MQIVELCIALTLPWLAGVILARYFLGARRSACIYLGHGFLLGAMAVSLLLRLYEWTGREFSFLELALILFIFNVVAFFRQSSSKVRRTSITQGASAIPQHPPKIWETAVIALTVLLAAITVFFVGQEILLRPVYAWDAWNSWEPETLQFFSARAFQQDLYTNANYGVLSTHFHLWTMLAMGTSETLAINTPWFACYLSISLAVYGHMSESHGRLPGILAGSTILTLPLLSTHAALTGYADIWLALSFLLGCLCLQEQRGISRIARILLLTLLYALACGLIKRTGLGFSLVLVLCIALKPLVQNFKPIGKPIAIALLGLGVACLIAIMQGWVKLVLPVPGLGQIVLDSTKLEVPLLFTYIFNPEFRLQPFLESLFEASNANLAPSIFLVTLAFCLLLVRSDLITDLFLAAILGSCAVIIFHFTVISPVSAFDHTGLDRAILCITPAALYWSIYKLALWARTGSLRNTVEKIEPLQNQSTLAN